MTDHDGCPHTSMHGTGEPDTWQCDGCCHRERHVRDPDGPCWDSQGHFRIDVLAPAPHPEPPPCLVDLFTPRNHDDRPTD
jgi:hypothetical protein